MKNILVAGAGLVGRAIAIDLSSKYNVSVVDNNIENLFKLPEDHIDVIAADFNDKNNYKRVVQEFDIIVGALPGFLGFEFIKMCIELEKDIVDISFCKEDVYELNALAKQNNVTAVFDCGVAPGLSNIVLGYHNSYMKINSFRCYVGGLPFERIPPYEYKAPFSPIDVIEEYTRPARIVEDGRVIVKPALSDIEILEFENAGKLEAFNTDGLRSLLYTMNIPDMAEKTLRYPGHIEKIQLLKDTGLLSDEPLEIGSKKIKPIELTSALLFDNWKLKEDDEEFTAMKIIIKGEDETADKHIEYNLFDKYDKKTRTSSMARTTGYTCASVVNLLAEGKIMEKGTLAPEIIGSIKQNFDFVINYLAERNVRLTSIVKSHSGI
ncbi:MAG: saccharopine dehydrogenase [Ignavibacteriae bacterium]|nr:MAG: saccharopine dehydrogenase [Ignavibacteriota bacterium]